MSQSIQKNKKIQKSIKNGFKIYILLDELDYGSKKGQLLSKIWRLVQDNLNKIKAVGFSATPHESLKEYNYSKNITSNLNTKEDSISFEAVLSKKSLGINEKLRVDFKINKDGDNFEAPSFKGFRGSQKKTWHVYW